MAVPRISRDHNRTDAGTARRAHATHSTSQQAAQAARQTHRRPPRLADDDCTHTPHCTSCCPACALEPSCMHQAAPGANTKRSVQLLQAQVEPLVPLLGWWLLLLLLVGLRDVCVLAGRQRYACSVFGVAVCNA